MNTDKADLGSSILTAESLSETVRKDCPLVEPQREGEHYFDALERWLGFGTKDQDHG